MEKLNTEDGQLFIKVRAGVFFPSLREIFFFSAVQSATLCFFWSISFFFFFFFSLSFLLDPLSSHVIELFRVVTETSLPSRI